MNGIDNGGKHSGATMTKRKAEPVTADAVFYRPDDGQITVLCAHCLYCQPAPTQTAYGAVRHATVHLETSHGIVRAKVDNVDAPHNAAVQLAMTIALDLNTTRRAG